MNSYKKTAGIFLTGFLIPFLIFAQTGFNTKIHDTIDKYGAIGLAAVVVKNNEIVYKGNFGYKDREQDIPLRSGDMFRIASISKSFTATGLLRLVDQGILSLDDEVSYLIGFKVNNPKYPDTPITLKMILSHTSSLNDDRGYFSLDTINPSKTKNWKEL